MYTFTRHERLKSRKTISRLFREGNAFVAYPLRVVWLPAEPVADSEAPAGRVEVAISVPRRAFKTAVARNRLKRRIREAYRLNKHLLYEKLAATDRCVALMLVFVGKEELPFETIAEGVRKMVKKFPV